MKRRQSLLVGVIFLLTALLAWEIFWPLPELPAAMASPATPSATSFSPPPPMPPRQQFSASDERPLFTVTRRPIPEAPPSSAIEAPPPPPSVLLIGILKDGQRQLALLKPPNAPAFTASLNQEVGGWTLVEITADDVTLRSGTSTQTLTLHRRQP